MLVSLTGFAGVVTDKLTADDFPATTTSYTDFTGVKKNSAAVYAGQSAKNDAGAIQMRSKNSNSGIVTTTSGGTVKSVTITVSSGTNTIDVYGSNTPYTSAADLYATSGNTSQGTKIGSVSETGTVTFTEDYKYVGIRSNNGAIYLASVEVEWTTAEEGSVNAPTFTPSEGKFVGSVEVSLAAETGCSIYYTLDGTDPTTASTKYTAPFTLTETTTVKAIAHNGTKASNVVSKTYTRYIDITNTAETAYTAAQAIEIIDNPLSDLNTPIYVKGTISKIDEIDIEGTYGNATYYIQDEDGTEMEVYRGYGLNGQKFNEEGATLIEVGNKVVVYGKVKKFNTTYEFDTASQIVSITATPAAEPNTTTKYFTAPELRDEVANVGQALVGILGVTSTGDKYINGATQTNRASANGTLAGVRAPEAEEVMEVIPAEGGYYLRQHAAEAGQGYLACSAGGDFSVVAEASANVWTIIGANEEGYGSVSGYDDIYTDIEKANNDNMIRFISQGQYLNGQTFGATGGLRGGTGAWSFNYIRNANYEEDEPTPGPEPIVFTDQLTVTVNDVSGTLDASVNLIKHEDGTIDFSLPNFVLAYGEDVMPVGNININGLTLVPGEEYDTFEYNDMLAITAGDLEGIDFWMGPALGEMPLKLQGKVNFDDHKLFVNIDIDLTESLAQIINVKFGTDFEEPAPYVGPAKNQLFTASTPQRGGWMNVDGALKGTLQGGASVATDATDANQLFALVDYEGKTYLWNEGAQHFLNDAGQFVSILTATPIYCTEEAGYEGVCDKTYFFHFSEEKNINLGGSKQILIDDWSEADAGNMMVINAAEGFDAEAVAAVIKSDTSLAVTNITWTITDGEGNEIATETQTQCEEGKEYTVQFSLYGVELKGETTVVAGKEDQNITLVAEFTGTLPIEYAATLDAVEHWYALRLHSNQQHWLYSDEGTLAFAGEEAQTDEYAWALVGDPLRGFQLYNKALGAAAALDAANPCTLSEDGLTARFYVHPTAEANHASDGFCLKAYGESQYLNYQGGAIKRWGAADAGSTFVFDEIVEIPDGINVLNTNESLNVRFNLQGQQVGTAFRGIYLQNRKKVLVK